MEILEYYDEERIKKESHILSPKRCLCIAILLLIPVFLISIYIVKINNELTNAVIAAFVVSTICSLFFFWMINLTEGEGFKSCKELKKLEKKYIADRKKILDKHNYRYSIYEKRFSIIANCNEIVREIMCDKFTINSNGHAFVKYSESNFILKETEPLKIEYHHITDNKDGHILTVKELKNFIAED